MEKAPPVPPKDTPTPSKSKMPTSAPASGSKRKREAAPDDTVYDLLNGRLVSVDRSEREHSPKRSRQSDSEDTSTGKPGLRRKKKVNNLSNLNLRHAAREQQQAAQQARESKFQEGSLTDRPSRKPPSAFTRMIRTESGNIKQVDEFMEVYQESELVQPPTVPSATPAATPSSGGMFAFGRTFGNFHPIALWNKMWNETKEELYRRNVEEAERKRREQQRLEAAAQYAKLKAAGQLGLTPVSAVAGSVPSSDEASTMRDSAVVMPNARTPAEHKRTASDVPAVLVHPTDEVESASGSEVRETASKGGALRSRLSFLTKPSISNLKGSVLKRVKSDYNLASTADRASSSSLSPVKQDFDQSTLRRSTSKYDIKKQQRLSKRVSDLEAKLNVARRELDNALIEASPAPKLNDRYARFTPQSTLQRQRFVPGRLATLPSERLLTAEQMSFGNDEATPTTKGWLGRGGDPSEMMDIDDEDTVKATRGRPYPTRAVDLFKLDGDHIGPPRAAVDEHINSNQDQEPTSSLTHLTTDAMDPNTALSTKPAPMSEPAGDYASLDAKLKALEKSAKPSRKPAPGKGKKRKSTGDDGDKLFRPGKETTDDDDEDEQEETTPRKKRKSVAKGEASNAQRGGKRGRKGQTGGKAEVHVESARVEENVEVFSEAEVEQEIPAGPWEEEQPATRTSLDSQGVPLEPVYEEEEEVSFVPINDEPSKPTATATPARFGNSRRSRSPVKTKAGAEEVIMTRAADAVKGRRGDGLEGRGNEKEEGFEWPDDVF